MLVIQGVWIGFDYIVGKVVLFCFDRILDVLFYELQIGYFMDDLFVFWVQVGYVLVSVGIFDIMQVVLDKFVDIKFVVQDVGVVFWVVVDC